MRGSKFAGLTNAQRHAVYRAEWKAANRCDSCGNPKDTGMTRCGPCQEKRLSAEKAKRAAKRKARICTMSGCHEPTRSVYLMCKQCRIENAADQRRLYHLKRKGAT